jgi:hypothetical protein
MSDYDNAVAQADKINKYWLQQGFYVGAKPQLVCSQRHDGEYWGVRSNLVNGLPSKLATKVAA